jgi:hypothetical protein
VQLFKWITGNSYLPIVGTDTLYVVNFLTISNHEFTYGQLSIHNRAWKQFANHMTVCVSSIYLSGRVMIRSFILNFHPLSHIVTGFYFAGPVVNFWYKTGTKNSPRFSFIVVLKDVETSNLGYPMFFQVLFAITRLGRSPRKKVDFLSP